jgi:hypothetical protein
VQQLPVAGDVGRTGEAAGVGPEVSGEGWERRGRAGVRRGSREGFRPWGVGGERGSGSRADEKGSRGGRRAKRWGIARRTKPSARPPNREDRPIGCPS